MPDLRAILEPCYSKLRRAEVHVNEATRLVDKWKVGRRWTIEKHAVIPSTQTKWYFNLAPLSEDIGHVVADALHNTRAPLDQLLTGYMQFVLGRPEGGRFKGIGFPVRRTRNDFGEALKALAVNGLAARAIDFLAELEPFEGGRDRWLYELHRLDIEDKHYPTILPLAVASHRQEVHELKVDGGRVLIIGSPRGQHMVSRDPAGLGPNDLEQRNPALRPTYREEDGRGFLEFVPPAGDLEFMTTTVGAEIPEGFEPKLKLDVHIEVSGGTTSATELAHSFLKGTRELVDQFVAELG